MHRIALVHNAPALPKGTLAVQARSCVVAHLKQVELENVRQQEVQDGKEFLGVVLDRSATQQQSALASNLVQALVPAAVCISLLRRHRKRVGQSKSHHAHTSQAHHHRHIITGTFNHTNQHRTSASQRS
jgi:hypothetical protein